MIESNNIPYYLAAFALFIVLKFSFAYADNDGVLFLTQPTNSVVSLITDSDARYSNEVGFYHEELNIVIDKSCSGFNFWILIFLIFLFTALKTIQAKRLKSLAFVLILIGAYLITIMVNSSRILTSMILNETVGNQYAWMHQAEGAFIYFSFLILFYVLFNYSLKKFSKNHAQFA